MPGHVSRRDFFKLGGLGTAGVAVSTLGIGTVLGMTPEQASAAEVEFIYTCPICGKQFNDYDTMESHFEKSHPDAAVPELAVLNINDIEYRVQIEPHWTLRETLQYALGLTGSAKEMCDRGACGSCSVLIDGEVALSCTVLAIECVGKKIVTIEDIAANEKWKPLVDAYIKYDCMQCGYCTPGQLTVASHLLENNPQPTEEDIRLALSGNICRCGTYMRHVQAIQEAAESL